MKRVERMSIFHYVFGLGLCFASGAVVNVFLVSFDCETPCYIIFSRNPSLSFIEQSCCYREPLII